MIRLRKLSSLYDVSKHGGKVAAQVGQEFLYKKLSFHDNQLWLVGGPSGMFKTSLLHRFVRVSDKQYIAITMNSVYELTEI